MGTIIDYEYQHTNRLRASPNNRVVTRPSEKFEAKAADYYMQNKPNFRKAKMNITPAITKDYENETAFELRQNKPNRTQFQPKNEADKPKQSQSYLP